MTLFENKEWARLLADAAADGTAQKIVRPTVGDDDADVLEAAVKKVQRGELSRARRLLDSCGLAPGNPATFAELLDVTLI